MQFIYFQNHSCPFLLYFYVSVISSRMMDCIFNLRKLMNNLRCNVCQASVFLFFCSLFSLYFVWKLISGSKIRGNLWLEACYPIILHIIEQCVVFLVVFLNDLLEFHRMKRSGSLAFTSLDLIGYPVSYICSLRNIILRKLQVDNCYFSFSIVTSF